MGAAVSATPMPSVRICQRGTFASHYLEAWRQGLRVHCETTTHPDRWSRTFTVGGLGSNVLVISRHDARILPLRRLWRGLGAPGPLGLPNHAPPPKASL